MPTIILYAIKQKQFKRMMKYIEKRYKELYNQILFIDEDDIIQYGTYNACVRLVRKTLSSITINVCAIPFDINTTKIGKWIKMEFCHDKDVKYFPLNIWGIKHLENFMKQLEESYDNKTITNQLLEECDRIKFDKEYIIKIETEINEMKKTPDYIPFGDPRGTEYYHPPSDEENWL